jgi:integrase
MARVGKMTVLKVAALARAKIPGYYSDGGGLFLQISRYGTASWVFRYRMAGRLREMGLGSLDTIGLADARERARKAREQRLDGFDPIERRKAARLSAQLDTAKAITFKDSAKRYITAHQPAWRNSKHAAQWGSTLETYVYPFFGGIAVQAVDVGLVLKAIEPIWTAKPETASRVRGRIESILDWATARGYRQGENPARWRGHLENLLPARAKVRRVEHHASLPYREIGAFITELQQQEGISACALEFAILTAARTGEVIGARWSEINIAERLWTIPGERMKGGREHRVPLSNAALTIIERMAESRHSDFVFPGGNAGRPLSNMAFLMLLRRMGRGGLTAHGFRSSFRDWTAERTNFSAEVAEMALAHVVSDKVEAAYRRGDLFQKRRQLAEAWAKFCAAAPPAGNIVPLRKAAHL